MASVSIGKRKVQNNFDNAAGDIPDDINIGMFERESVVCNSSENQLIGKVLRKEEMALGALLAMSIYLLNGEYAQMLCTLITSIPPAIFSYRVLINQKTEKDGYHAILFYWTIYGILAFIDQFVGNAQGYSFCKVGFLGTVFWHAVRTNPLSIPKSWQIFEVANSPDRVLSSLFTKYDSQGFVKKTNSSGFMPRTPTMTEFSDVSEYMPHSSAETGESEQIKEFDYVEEDIDVSTACSFIPSLEMQTTQKISPEVLKKESEKTLRIEEEEVSTPRAQQTPAIGRAAPPNFQSMSAMTITAGAQKDIVTVPSDKLEFSFDKREVNIQVTNVSPLHVMFVLKTNMDTHLIGAPTNGMLYSGQSTTIRVGVKEEFFEQHSDPGRSIDKLAIDYTLIPQSHSRNVTQFNSQFFQSLPRRRHAIRVFYH